ncbi:60S ribosomal protein L6 [Spraguea lophii 42_110]|uniref:60S ribosomal protein L6 n=1 Tax=Spraguea lophii (strain 42_110) TaxID=1358809 RepID=S7W5S3_SPRLO|nr:Chain LE0, 60S ribosomal protein L6 [Spraguea lophii 42_110]7QJH_KE0 Chain KE0, 60S ribosomal protein L6 [Spraguea lophii 42_110]7QJH_LE0 Chain LE0, 60S ribosomal protein L6 [Spraguea lophii 42_110]8BR3_LE0 Chain LE0, 60S ribosomal protein L6 [Spraguea lophii 42_110]8P5D_LE0 Chain LE0, 60S ribosomal protein L6 [Spraguea lophii 42_110]8P60_KE0 Chain KE0, 60S ribosomal protein L6 [Spraguea lophii 42_110]8P60_LE0 Chain LE0, 60S ribosomal protein L6 [Spraguea lophii 42_110]EPR78126.1 60S ribo
MQSERQQRLNISNIKNYYTADDIPAFAEKLLELHKPAPIELRTDLVQGNVVVVLEGEYASYRVVYLSRTEDNKALCMGLPSINGIGLFEIDERFLLRTSIVLDIRLDKKYRAKESKRSFKKFNTKEKVLTKEENDIEELLLKEIENEKFMKKYFETPYEINNTVDFYEINH